MQRQAAGAGRGFDHQFELKKKIKISIFTVIICLSLAFNSSIHMGRQRLPSIYYFIYSVSTLKFGCFTTAFRMSSSLNNISHFFTAKENLSNNKHVRQISTDSVSSEFPSKRSRTANEETSSTTAAAVDNKIASDITIFDSLINTKWRSKLITESNKPYFTDLSNFLELEYSSKTVFPAKNQIFNAFNLASFDNVKVSTKGDYIICAYLFLTFLLHFFCIQNGIYYILILHYQSYR